MPPKIYRYAVGYARVVIRDGDLPKVPTALPYWCVATSASDAARQCGVLFSVNTEGDFSDAVDGTSIHDTYVYTDEQCVIWARRMRARPKRRMPPMG